MTADDEVMEALDVVLQVVLPDESEGTARRALEALRQHHRCRAGAVFIPGAGITRLKPLVASAGLDRAGVDRAHAVWAASRDALEAGAWRECSEAGIEYLLVPLFHVGSLAALLYMDSEEPGFLVGLDRERVVLMGRVLAASAVAKDPWLASSAEMKGHFGRASADQVRQAHLLAVIEENGGVVARVAKRMRVSRPTIYNWCRKYGIELPPGRKRPTLSSG